MTTWTEHKLTDAQCHVLASFIAEETTGKKYTHKHGMASFTLKGKGLVTRFEDRPDFYPCCTITAAGRQALKDARSEGW